MKKTVISLLAMLVCVAAFGQRADSVGCNSEHSSSTIVGIQNFHDKEKNRVVEENL